MIAPLRAARCAGAGLFACAISMSLPASGQLDESEHMELALEVGQQRVLSSDGVSSYSEGIPGIIEVRLTRDGKQFVILGKRAGTTSLLMMLKDGGERAYTISVIDPTAALRDPAGEGDRVEARDNIRLDLYFVQVSRDYRHQIGMSFPTAIGRSALSASVNLTTGTLTDATAVITDQALPSLDLAQANGWAKLLRRAAVVTQNGSEASFGGGGELNLPVISALGVGVRQIQFGSRIRVRPRYDRDSARLELAIEADVSDLTSDLGSGMPGRTTSVLSSTVNLELGQSIVLAGLSARSEAHDKAGLPGLSQLPILGVLFGSHAQRHQASENLVFIVPSVIDAIDSDARIRVEQALRAYREFDGDVEESEVLELRDRGSRKGAKR